MNAKYVKCAAKCCGNTLLDNSNLTFFTFPENTELAKIWAENAKVSYYYYGSTLCSDHFEDKFFNQNFGKRSVFRQDMEPIPTIFNIKNKNDGDTSIPNVTNDNKKDGVVSIPKVTLVDPAKIINQPSDPVQTLKEYCRLCANLFPIKNMNTIFFKYNEMIETCLPGKVFQNDPLSQYICLSCSHKVKECAKMLKVFQEADKKLHEMLNPKSVTQKQPSTSTFTETEVINISDDDGDDDDDDDDDDDNSANFNEKDLLDDLMNVLTETNNILDEIANDPLNVSDSEEPESPPVKIRKTENYETKTKYRFQCLKCSKLFDYKEQVLVHAYHEHPYNRNDKIISRVVPQKVQELKVEPPRVIKYQCVACNIIYDTKDEIFNHTSSVHNGNKSVSKIIEVAEIPQKTLTIKYMCLSCPTVRETQLEMRRHASLYHSNTKIISKAIICDKEFSENAPVINNAPFMKQVKPKDYNGPSSDIKNYHSLFNELGIGSADHFHALYARKPKPDIPIINYNVKYKCISCSEFRDSYNEIYDHFEKEHSDSVEQADPVAIVCKVKEGCDLSVDNNPENVIQINDGTITGIDPSEKQERLKYSEPKLVPESGFKCLDCNKIYRTKQILIKHALAKHPNELNEINCKQVTVQRRVDSTKGKNKFECLICSTLHISKFSLLKHTELLHPNISKNKFLYRFLEQQKRGPIQCLRCSYNLKSFSQYCSHSKTHICFKCNECDKKFVKVHLLKEHEKEHDPTDNKIWTCIVCDEEFTNKTLLLRHENTHKTLKDVQCPKCNKKFTSEYHLKKHEKKVHETCLCDVCGKTYELPYIKHHLQTHNTDCPFKCKHCSKTFKTASILFRHQRKHYTTTEKTICQICGKVIGRSSLTLHMKTHSTEKDEVCDICGASFHRRDHLRQHRARHETGERTYECVHCLTILSSKKSYLQHLSSVHGIKQNDVSATEKKKFQCTICDKKFPSKTYLADHYRWHRGEKIYSCDTCGKNFGTKLAVYQHKLTHLPYEQFKYECNICQKRFKRNEQYRNHRRVHTGEKPFPCPICQRPFRVRGEMVKHMRVHTPIENRTVRYRLKTKPKETPTPIITQRTLETVPPAVIKTKTKPKEIPTTIITKRTLEAVGPAVIRTYVRPKIQTVVRPAVNIKTKDTDIESVNINTDNIFESNDVLRTKNVKISKVKTGLNQTIFYIDDSSSDSASAEEMGVGRNMPNLE